MSFVDRSMILVEWVFERSHTVFWWMKGKELLFSYTLHDAFVCYKAVAEQGRLLRCKSDGLDFDEVNHFLELAIDAGNVLGNNGLFPLA